MANKNGGFVTEPLDQSEMIIIRFVDSLDEKKIEQDL